MKNEHKTAQRSHEETTTAPEGSEDVSNERVTPVDFATMTTDVRESVIAGEKDVVHGEAYAVTNKGLGVLLDSSDPMAAPASALHNFTRTTNVGWTCMSCKFVEKEPGKLLARTCTAPSVAPQVEQRV